MGSQNEPNKGRKRGGLRSGGWRRFQEGREMADVEVLDWLEEQVVDVIYLDDGRIIDVKGLSVRAALLKAIEVERSARDREPN